MNLSQVSSLLNLIFQRCEVFCVRDCCGRDAFDFSPIHLASTLALESNCQERMTDLRLELARVKEKCGAKSRQKSGLKSAQFAPFLSAEDVDEVVDEILANLEIALELIEISESKRFKRITA